jgi:hypothetical protein
LIVDELILKLQADLSDVKKKLAQVENDAAKAGKEAGAAMGKAAGTSFGDVFNAIAGAAVLNTVKGFYAKAAQEFNKFEAAFLRVDSIAKGFGRSVNVARKNVEELADKGFLNLNQAASSYADAIALGFDEKKARTFIDSLSDIAAFQNTIGDGAAAVQSGLAGLLSNSAEKVENIGVPVKVLNMQYNENIKTMGKAAALQKFYTGILKESEKFQGDAAKSVETLAGAQNKYNAAVDKAAVAIGKGLEPMLKSLYQTLQQGFEIFAKWFGNLDATTKSLAILVPLVGALVLALGTLVPVLKTLAIMNPFGWIPLAISGLVALVAVVNELVSVNPARIVKEYRETSNAMKDLGEKAKELEAINKRTATQEKELIDIKEKLRQRARALGLDYDQLAKSAGSAAAATEILTRRERERQADILRADLKKTQEARGRVESQAEFFNSQFGKQLGGSLALNIGLGAFGGTENLKKILAKKEAEDIKGIAEIYQDLVTNAGAPAAAAAAAAKSSETRFVESQSRLLEIEKNRLFTIANINKKLSDEERQRQRDNADKDAEYQRQSLRGSFRQVFAEYIEDKVTADLNALQETTRNAKRASEEQLTFELNLAGKNEGLIQQAKLNNRNRLAKIDEANAKKQAEIAADSVARNLQAANAIAQGIGQVSSGTTSGQKISGAGSAIAGAGGLKDIFPSLSVLAPIGLGIGAIAGIGSLIENAWGKSEEERRKEAAQQAQRDEEARKILELQANYQKSMLALQEASAKLPFEDLQRQLRLIDIGAQQSRLAGVDEQTIERQTLAAKQAAITSTLQSESGAIGEGRLFAGTGSSADDLIGFLSERAAQSAAIGQFMSLVDLVGSNTLSPEQYEEVKRQAMTYKGKIPDEIYNAAFNQSGGFAYGGIKSVRADWVETQTVLGGQPLIARVRELVSEVGVDAGIAENLLSVIEQQLAIENQINDNTKKTAENTSKALELRPDRERSFIDVGRGFIQSLGQIITTPSALGIAKSLSAQEFTVPSEIGSATVTMGRARTLQERMADAMERQVMQGAEALDIAYDMRAALYDLLAVLDANPNTQNKISVTEFTRAQSEINRRRT